MTDYKQLCARMADELDHYRQLLMDDRRETHALATEARAALAQPEPEWPTDEEIMELMPQQMRDDLAAAARALSGFDPDNIKAASVFRIILNRHAVDHALAVLAKWGNHPESPDSSTQPIPVSGRLPGLEDCDAEGRCWWHGEGGDMVGWTYQDSEGFSYYKATHWLPAHALPQPS